MRIIALALSSLIIFAAACSPGGSAGDRSAGAGDTAAVRIPADSVGYALRPEQVERIVSVSDSMMAEGLPLVHEAPPAQHGEMIGAIVPHDDYLFAGPYYVMTVGRIRAPLVVMFGVAHRARRIGLEGKLIFDDYGGWMGPYGVTKVSPLRERLIAERIQSFHLS